VAGVGRRSEGARGDDDVRLCRLDGMTILSKGEDRRVRGRAGGSKKSDDVSSGRCGGRGRSLVCGRWPLVSRLCRAAVCVCVFTEAGSGRGGRRAVSGRPVVRAGWPRLREATAAASTRARQTDDGQDVSCDCATATCGGRRATGPGPRERGVSARGRGETCSCRGVFPGRTTRLGDCQAVVAVVVVRCGAVWSDRSGLSAAVVVVVVVVGGAVGVAERRRLSSSGAKKKVRALWSRGGMSKVQVVRDAVRVQQETTWNSRAQWQQQQQQQQKKHREGEGGGEGECPRFK
jgi:hypothetical protein